MKLFHKSKYCFFFGCSILDFDRCGQKENWILLHRAMLRAWRVVTCLSCGRWRIIANLGTPVPKKSDHNLDSHQ